MNYAASSVDPFAVPVPQDHNKQYLTDQVAISVLPTPPLNAQQSLRLLHQEPDSIPGASSATQGPVGTDIGPNSPYAIYPQPQHRQHQQHSSHDASAIRQTPTGVGQAVPGVPGASGAPNLDQLQTGHHGHSGFVAPPFHHPFDPNSYPLTNPPLFDSTMKFSYNTTDGQQRRRRISILNGQISQIISHQAELEGDSPLEDFLKLSGDPVQLDYPYRGPQQPGTSSEAAIPGADDGSGVVTTANAGTAVLPPSSGSSNDAAFVDAAGVPPPNHALLYDNEIIYNPNDGPIPGTAAWKKERLLERNRIAALKCRQRKKQAQQALQKSIQSYQAEVNELTEKLETYEALLLEYRMAAKAVLKGSTTVDLEAVVSSIENLGIKEA